MANPIESPTHGVPIAPKAPLSVSGRSPRKLLLGAFLALATLACAFIIVELAYPPQGGKGAPKLDDAFKESIKVHMDSVQSFMTWSLALIGAVAYFLKSSLEGDLELQRSDFGLCLVVVVLAVISMFFGTLVQNDAFQLLGNGTVPVRNERVMRLGACQYLSFLAALLAFGLHVVQFFTRARRPSATAGTPSSEESGST